MELVGKPYVKLGAGVASNFLTLDQSNGTPANCSRANSFPVIAQVLAGFRSTGDESGCRTYGFELTLRFEGQKNRVAGTALIEAATKAPHSHLESAMA